MNASWSLAFGRTGSIIIFSQVCLRINRDTIYSEWMFLAFGHYWYVLFPPLWRLYSPYLHLQVFVHCNLSRCVPYDLPSACLHYDDVVERLSMHMTLVELAEQYPSYYGWVYVVCVFTLVFISCLCFDFKWPSLYSPMLSTWSSLAHVNNSISHHVRGLPSVEVFF